MESLRIGTENPVVLQVVQAHKLRLSGLLEAYDEPGDRPLLRCAWLGFCLKGQAKPPHRNRHEPYTIYGQRVYDHLESLGATHWEIVEWASECMAEGIQALPAPPTRQEVAELGESSTAADSDTG